MADFHSLFEQSPVSANSTPPEELRENIRRLMTALRSSDSANSLTNHQIQGLVGDLPRLTEVQVISLGHRDSVCPICFTPFLGLLAEEEMALAMDSPAHPIEELGVTRLAQAWQCGHVFCKRDISKWINDGHDSCPTCRHLFLEPGSTSVRSTSQPGAQGEVNSESDADVLLQELESQISSMFPMGTHDRFPAFGQSRFGRRAPASDEDSNRDEYAGMYS